MSSIALREAQEHLACWMEADKAVSLGQSYSMGTRSLTRADAREIRENIIFWQNKVRAIKRGAGFRIHQGLPR